MCAAFQQRPTGLFGGVIQRINEVRPTRLQRRCAGKYQNLPNFVFAPRAVLGGFGRLMWTVYSQIIVQVINRTACAEHGGEKLPVESEGKALVQPKIAAPPKSCRLHDMV